MSMRYKFSKYVYKLYLNFNYYPFFFIHYLIKSHRKTLIDIFINHGSLKSLILKLII